MLYESVLVCWEELLKLLKLLKLHMLSSSAAQDMFSSIDQLKTESHVDVQQSSFAHQLEMSQGGSCRSEMGQGTLML